MNIISGIYTFYIKLLAYMTAFPPTTCYVIAFILSCLTWSAIAGIIFRILYIYYLAPQNSKKHMDVYNYRERYASAFQQMRDYLPDKVLSYIPRNTSFYGSNDEQYYFLNTDCLKSFNLIKNNLKIQDINQETGIEDLKKVLVNKTLQSNLKELEKKLSLHDKEYLSKYIPFPYAETKNMINDINKTTELIIDEFEGYQSDIKICKKGMVGEKSVYNDLRLYENRYHILTNIRIEVNKKSSESDIIIISEKGVFIVEIKNYGKAGETINIDTEGTWTKVRGKYVDEVKDAVDQNKYHCEITNKLLNNELKAHGYYGVPEINCISIVCIANNEVNLRNLSHEIIVRASNIIPTIQNYKTDRNLDTETQIELRRILTENSLEPLLYPVDSRSKRIESLVDNFKYLNTATQISQDIYIKYCKEVLKIDTDNILKKEEL